MKVYNVLVVGLGIGNMYVRILESEFVSSTGSGHTYMKYNVDTLDSDKKKNPTYTSIEDITKTYDLIIIATPNYLHEELVYKLLPYGSKFLVDKPGFETADAWYRAIDHSEIEQITMVKNNIYRDTIREFVDKGDTLALCWFNKNRIPKPGSWFTTKRLSFGGVSRDLMPHLLSMYLEIKGNPDISKNDFKYMKEQSFFLSEIKSTDYGEVDPAGVYDVDDKCNIIMKNNFDRLCAEWTSEKGDVIELINVDTGEIIKFGLCPEIYYMCMFNDVIDMSEERYEYHKKMDLTIHSIIENI